MPAAKMNSVLASIPIWRAWAFAYHHSFEVKWGQSNEQMIAFLLKYPPSDNSITSNRLRFWIDVDKSAYHAI
jgi:hypothetical protein